MVFTDILKGVVFSACAAAVGISLIDMLYPENRFGKQMRFIFSAVFIIVLATPLVSGELKLDPQSAEIAASSVKTDEKVVGSYFKASVEKNIALSLTKRLAAAGINTKKISVSINIAEDESISITKVIFIPENAADFSEAAALMQNELGECVEICGEEM